MRALYNYDNPCTRRTGGVGGHLHIVLDDNNVDDYSVKLCLDEAEKDHCTTCIELAQVLMMMSMTQRYKLSLVGTR